MTERNFDQPYRGGTVGREHHFALTVYFEDTDAYGIVYYANYLKFMERARSDMLRAAGIDQAAELAATGRAYAVVDVHIHYRRPARLGDDLRIVSTVDAIRASSVHIQQRVSRGEELLAEARLTAAFLDKTGRPMRHPAAWLGKFEQFTGEGQKG
jgi:acyl-CoA thioester hydrolase